MRKYMKFKVHTKIQTMPECFNTFVKNTYETGAKKECNDILSRLGLENVNILKY